MLNKNKIINVAQKHIQKGQYGKAIRELQKLVEEDPRDVRTLLKIGDIFSKKGDKEEATRTYRRVAEFYSDQGFFLKAVAVYKQILKYEPRQLEVTLKLAELYEHLGLTQEAMGQYQNVANLQDHLGNSKESLGVLSRMVDLDPSNVAARVRLAEGYSRENMVSEAVEEFALAAETLRSQNRIADYVKVAERLVYHEPNRIETIKELARLYLQRADTKRALAKLQLAFKSHPRDIEVLNLLATAFRELGQLPKTIFVYRELAKLYEENGSKADAQNVYRRVLELAPGDPQACAALGIATAPSSPAPAPTPVEAPAQPKKDASSIRGAPVAGTATAAAAVVADAPAAPAKAQNDEHVAKLLTETDVYIKYGLRDKAIEHLRRVIDIDRTSVVAFEKMRDIYVAADDGSRAAEAVASILKIHARAGAGVLQEDARQALADLAPGHPLAQPGAAIPEEEEEIAEDIDIDLATGAFNRDDLELDSSSIPVVGDAPPAGQNFGPGTEELLADAQPEVMDAAAHSASEDLEVDEFLEISNFDVPSDEPAWSPEIVTIDQGNAGSSSGGQAAVHFLDEEDDDDDDLLGADSGIISFASGGTPVPERASDPKVGMRDLLPSQRPTHSPPLTMEMPIINLPSEAPSAEQNDELEEELDSAAFFAQQGLHEEARDTIVEVLRKSPHYARAVGMLARLDLGEPLEDSVDDADVVGIEFASVGESVRSPFATDLAIPTFDTHPSELPATLASSYDAAPADGEEDAASETAVFSMNPEAFDEGDLEARHDLGLAYKEMGMYDEAITEFQVAAQSPSRTVEAFAMIGHCLMAQEDTVGAVGYFFTAIESGADPKLATELKYEIGSAYDAGGDVDKALHWYGAAYRDNQRFRDVRDRIVALGGSPDEEFNTDDALLAVSDQDIAAAKG